MGLLRLLGAWLRVLRILPHDDTANEARSHPRLLSVLSKSVRVAENACGAAVPRSRRSSSSCVRSHTRKTMSLGKAALRPKSSLRYPAICNVLVLLCSDSSVLHLCSVLDSLCTIQVDIHSARVPHPADHQ